MLIISPLSHFLQINGHSMVMFISVNLSTGCKTLLNIYYNPDKLFFTGECGKNAWVYLFTLPEGIVLFDRHAYVSDDTPIDIMFYGKHCVTFGEFNDWTSSYWSDDSLEGRRIYEDSE